jgi:hypothetical protein
LLYFLDRFYIFLGPALDYDPSTACPSFVAGITGAYHHAQLVDWDELSITFHLGCLES